MKELLACSHVSARPACQPRVTWAQGRGDGPPRRVHSHLCLPQPFSKSATEHVQGHLMKRQVPPDLFQVCAELIPHCFPAQPGSPSAQAKESSRLPLWRSHQPLPSSLSRTSKRFVKTSEGMCSRNSSRGESRVHAGEAAGRGRDRPGEGRGWHGGEKPPWVRPWAGGAWACLHLRQGLLRG